MSRLRRIMGTALLWALPKRAKEARINRAVRQSIPLSFPPPWLRRFNVTGYQTPPSPGDPWISTAKT